MRFSQSLLNVKDVGVKMRIIKKGQVIFEYLIFLTAAIIVFLVFLRPNGLFQGQLEESLDLSIRTINGIVEDIQFPNRDPALLGN